ncbi:MAG: single-stranded DNA-binding protein [Clostridia bacterium]|nr:single-stranded DNA-binding protein [Clostridia bacterium]
MLNCAEDNEARLVGFVNSNLEYSHAVLGESFYKVKVRSERLSENQDEITVTVSERLIGDMDLDIGVGVEVIGQFRSYNNYSGEGSRLILTLFAREIYLSDQECDNEIYLNGYICKPAVFRTTPFGREIADILLAVNRAYGKSDYIPCIAWGRNARFCENLPVGSNIKVWGRMQSRKYQKKLDEETTVEKTAYEVSVSKLELIN